MTLNAFYGHGVNSYWTEKCVSFDTKMAIAVKLAPNDTFLPFQITLMSVREIDLYPIIYTAHSTHTHTCVDSPLIANGFCYCLLTNHLKWWMKSVSMGFHRHSVVIRWLYALFSFSTSEEQKKIKTKLSTMKKLNYGIISTLNRENRLIAETKNHFKEIRQLKWSESIKSNLSKILKIVQNNNEKV